MQDGNAKVLIAAQVPAELRDDLERLAHANDKSISAEIRAALRLHLRVNDVGGSPPLAAHGPVERRVPEEVGPTVDARPHSGQEQT
jgi:hypothetical protein